LPCTPLVRSDPEATGLLQRGGVQGVALVTSLAPETAHLAQLAVRRGDRGGGLGRRLVCDVIRRAARAGKRSLTLLVGESNVEARRLYASLGFTQRGRFLSAHASTVNFCPGVSIPETQPAGNTANLST
jgi:ribosomal protein S18 acetylase RimI-like enzyme